MVYGLDTPRAEPSTMRSFDSIDLPSMEESFRSPGHDKNVLQAGRNNRRVSGNARLAATPVRNNRGHAGAGKEFTPLLKSVHMSQMKSKFARNRVMDSPVPGMGEDADETFRSGDNTAEMKLNEMSSIASTPGALPARRRGRDQDQGVLQTDGQMLTLREQERIIDEMKKENFSLKLKTVLLEDRLTKTGPEYQQQAIRENIEIKIEREHLKMELKKYKKSMSQSEKAISELRKDLTEMEGKADREFRNGKRGEEADKVLKEMMVQLEDKEKELESVLDENDKLRDEADQLFDKLNQLEHGDTEGMERLKKEVEELKADKEDLEAELRQKIDSLDQKEDELESIQHDLREKTIELKELEVNKNSEIAERDLKIREMEAQARELKGTVDKLREEKLGVEGNMDGALKTSHQRIDTLQQTINQLQSQLDRERASNTSASKDRELLETRIEKLEEDHRQLELRYEQLEDEKDALDFEKKKLENDKEKLQVEKDGIEDDLESLRDELKNKSFSYKSRFQERDDARKEIQEELTHLQQEYDNLQILHDDKVRECERMERRLNDVNGEFDGEAHALQSKLEAAHREKDAATKVSRELEQELRKIRSELHNTTTEKDLLQHRHDALTSESASLQKELAKLKANMREINSALQYEQEAAAANEQNLRDEWKSDSDKLTEALERAKAAMEERRQQHERMLNDWNMEKRQLEGRVEKAETNAKNLQNSINKLHQMEQTLTGKETRVQQAFDDERERHRQSETALNQQIRELNDEIVTRKANFEKKVSECNNLREELRLSKKSEKTLEERIRLLDDEVEVLSAQLEDAGQDNNHDLVSLRAECDALRKKLAATKQELTRVENEGANVKADLQTLKIDLEAEFGTQKQLKIQLQEANRRLENTLREKKEVQDRMQQVANQANAIKSTAQAIEAERDELLSQLNNNHKSFDHSIIDNEKMDLRKAKNKLEHDLERVRDERSLLSEKVQQLEADLEDAFTDATKEQAKLEKQIWELQHHVKTIEDGREREASVAKRTIARLEQRIEELMQMDGHDSSLDLELATVREQLTEVKRREAEAVQKDALSKKTIRELRLRIDKLELELSDVKAEAAVRGSSSFYSTGSARKSELEEARNHLATSNEQIRDLRTKLKALERTSSSQKSAYEKLDYEKQLLEQEVADIRNNNDELVNKNIEASGTIGDLRQKVIRLEKNLNDARLSRASEANRDVEQQIAEERQELHNHVKQYTLEIDNLHKQVEARNQEIRSQTKKQRELEAQLRSMRREKETVDANVDYTANELRKQQAKYLKAKEKLVQIQQAWDAERKAISQRVRFSESEKSDKEVMALEKAISESEARHIGELRGLAKQIRYLKARVAREKNFRDDLSFAKSFFLMQINLYSTCNEANLQMIEQMGIYPDRSIREKRPSIRSVAHALIAINRMKNRKASWEVNKEMHNALAKTLEKTRRRASGRIKDVVL